MVSTDIEPSIPTPRSDTSQGLASDSARSAGSCAELSKMGFSPGGTSRRTSRRQPRSSPAGHVRSSCTYVRTRQPPVRPVQTPGEEIPLSSRGVFTRFCKCAGQGPATRPARKPPRGKWDFPLGGFARNRPAQARGLRTVGHTPRLEVIQNQVDHFRGPSGHNHLKTVLNSSTATLTRTPGWRPAPASGRYCTSAAGPISSFPRRRVHRFGAHPCMWSPGHPCP